MLNPRTSLPAFFVPQNTAAKTLRVRCQSVAFDDTRLIASPCDILSTSAALESSFLSCTPAAVAPTQLLPIGAHRLSGVRTVLPSEIPALNARAARHPSRAAS